MDGVLAAAQGHGRSAHRIVGRTARDHVGQGRLVALDLARGRPRGMQVLSVDMGLPCPLLAGFADADGIADRVAVAHHVVQAPLAGPDDDGAGCGRIEGDDLAGLCRRRYGSAHGEHGHKDKS